MIEFEIKFWSRQPRTLYIIRGLPGSGKTTLAKRLTRHQVAADDFPGLYANGAYNLELQAQSHAWCKSKVENWMQWRKRQIAVHNTFVQQKYIQPYLELASQYGYAVQVIHAEAVISPCGNYAQSVHGVPPDVAESMKSRWESFTQRTHSRPF